MEKKSLVYLKIDGFLLTQQTDEGVLVLESSITTSSQH
jgi:hypothetical protein